MRRRKRGKGEPGGFGGTLTEKKVRYLRAILSGSTVKEAAEAAEICRATAYNWLEDPKFMAQLEALQQALMEQATTSLIAAIQPAARNVFLEVLKGSVAMSFKLLDRVGAFSPNHGWLTTIARSPAEIMLTQKNMTLLGRLRTARLKREEKMREETLGRECPREMKPKTDEERAAEREAMERFEKLLKEAREAPYPRMDTEAGGGKVSDSV